MNPILKRLLLAPVVLWVLVTVTFFLLRAVDGGPLDSERAVEPAVKAALEARYHLDEGLGWQYLRFLGDLVQGDLGPSFKQPDRAVQAIIADYLPTSAWLGALAMGLAITIGLFAGVFAAVRHRQWGDQGTMLIALVGLSLPTFVTGPMLMLVFATGLHILPVAGYDGPLGLGYLVLPAVTLALPFAARIARLVRAGMLEVVNQDFVRTARAMGLSECTVIIGHALRGALLPVIGFLGPAVAQVVTGSLVVEKIFQIPGLGREFVEAAFNRDYTLVMGTVIVYGALLILVNLLSDLAYAALDPRVDLDG